jgi:putative oxidoreductase
VFTPPSFHTGSNPFNVEERAMRLTAFFIETWKPRLLSVLRIVVAFMFMSHGMQKILSFPTPPARAIDLASVAGIAGLLELFGGALLLVGLFTRPVAFLLSGEMALAYFMAHAPQGFWPLLNRGELAVPYCFLFLYFAVAGAGVWSIDWWWRHRADDVRHRGMRARAGMRGA